ncbi:39S ribosomal L39, mitochondrial [Gossypium arboreum]|uniref:39S ribosomal L39, mitochondrial n=1 Tax=Gossypium arboreum TaxID=29729 RepID=A0A0B0NZ56_GOSAR|nr:39S ribosomal L39, mitochondrial [Gossypium arboreum]
MENHRGLSVSISKPRPYFDCDEEDELHRLGTEYALACVQGHGMAAESLGRTEAWRPGLGCGARWTLRFLPVSNFGPLGPIQFWTRFSISFGLMGSGL